MPGNGKHDKLVIIELKDPSITHNRGGQYMCYLFRMKGDIFQSMYSSLIWMLKPAKQFRKEATGLVLVHFARTLSFYNDI